MNDLIALLTFSAGLPLLVVGYFMSVRVTWYAAPKWKFGMILGFPVALPLFALVFWKKAQKAFWFSSTGAMLILYTWLSIPD